MSRKLPPLNSLRAFECAARHMSFTMASQELNVTQAAVSQQVKTLESYLGLPLFKRLTRKLVLTEEGQLLQPELSEALDQIGGAVAKLRDTTVAERLTVRLGPSLAARWLLPKLSAFWQLHPNIDLCFYHSNSPVDFDREDIDMAITYGNGQWRGVTAEHLLASDYFPVCHPTLLDHSHGSLQGGLAAQTLLHDARYYDWEQWLNMAGISDVNPRRGIIIDDTNVLIEAALSGQGVALCSTMFVKDHLLTGQLVKPFSETLHSGDAYYIVYPPKHLERSAVREFRSWLLEQDNEGPSVDQE
ncbi:MAG: transcriptional regulator GcvA [Pseudomonadales bacterium]